MVRHFYLDASLPHGSKCRGNWNDERAIACTIRLLDGRIQLLGYILEIWDS